MASLPNHDELMPITALSGVGKQIEKHLARLNIFSVQDLLFHFPSRYQDRTQILPIAKTQVGQEITVHGVIKKVHIVTRSRTRLMCELNDGTASISLRFFHIHAFQKTLLKQGTKLSCFGEIRLGPKGREMFHPEFKVLNHNEQISNVEQYLTPIYPTTEGLNQYTLRKITTAALILLKQPTFLCELIPTMDQMAPVLKQAIALIHRPPSTTCMMQLAESKTHFQQRIIFEELLAHRLSLLHLKRAYTLNCSIALTHSSDLSQQFIEQLPFKLTQAQARVTEEIYNDLKSSKPMLRLIQGDVGSGKTVVAALAMLKAVENGYQAALMVPTELLAEQHFQQFKKWFEPLGINIIFLTGSIKGRARTLAKNNIESGQGNIVVGTHALFQKEIIFPKLALVVIDEQHRFGVQQRALLRDKGISKGIYPHQLIMTATPIPRTLAMSFYADLDCSVIDELPPGRKPVVTSVLAEKRRELIIERIREVCKQGSQVYWVCPLIEESETISSQAATDTATILQQLLPELKVALVHGRMSAQAKQEIMGAFKRNEVKILVATTVIEVGVDVPNASVMVIENAERLGLSQLHQLRGRVGRGQTASYCILLYQYLSPMAKERLAVMRETNDGFKIAERDLQLRGPGEILGTKQTGDISFYIADLNRDQNLLTKVQKTATDMMLHNNNHVEPLINRWLKGQDYGKV